MGSSLVEFRGKRFWARDGILEFWLHMLSAEIDRLDSVEPWLNELGKEWYIQSKIGGSGIISADFDDDLTPDQVEQLIELNKKTMLTVLAFGDVIPLAFLNETCPPGCYYLGDGAPKEFVRIGEYFDALLNERVLITPDYRGAWFV